MTTLNKNEKSSLLSKSLFTITLIMILLRKYMISILRTDLPMGSVTSLLFYGSIGLLFIQFLLLKKHNITELSILAISCLLYVMTREGSILVLTLLAISIRYIDDDYVVKSYVLLTIFFVFACILLGNLRHDIAQVPQVHYRFAGGKYIPRETFGFTNPNSVFLFLLPVFAGYIYLRYENYNMIDRILLFVTTYFIYNKTMSRTGFLTIIVALIFVDVVRNLDFKKYSKIAKSIKFIPIVFLIISVAIGTILSNVKLFSKLLASRPIHWNVYLAKEGSLFTLFGNKYSDIVKASHPLDSSYIYIVAMLGIVSLIFFMYLLYKGLDIFIKKEQKKYIIIVFMFLIYSLAENILLEAGYNFTIILLIKHVMNNNQNNFYIRDLLRQNKFIQKRA